MENTPLVAAINDICGYGRCSLTVTIPIISAMGLQVCPLPTAVLSSHTGYPNYKIVDFTPYMDSFATNWQELSLKFKGIYTGFLANTEQSKKVYNFIKNFAKEDTIVLVDPIMGDNGSIYPFFNEEIINAMKKLLKKATVVTPNLTEACILSGCDFNSLLPLSKENFLLKITVIGKYIQTMGPKQVVITSVKYKDEMFNAVFDDEKPVKFVKIKAVKAHFSGTGDVFASIVFGYLSKDVTLYEAVKRATDFISKVVDYTSKQQNNFKNGISFEPFLKDLICE